MIERPCNPTPIAPVAQLADHPRTTCRRVASQRLFLDEVDPDELAPSERAVQEIRPGLFAVETLLYPGVRGLDLHRIRRCYPQITAPELSTKLGYFHPGPLS